jgi:hypothetical protein
MAHEFGSETGVTVLSLGIAQIQQLLAVRHRLYSTLSACHSPPLSGGTTKPHRLLL